MSGITHAADAEGYNIRTIALALGVTKRAAELRANREKWPFTRAKSGRVWIRLYRLADLPADVQAAILLRANRAATAQEQAPRQHRDRSRRWTDEQLRSAWQRYERVTDDLKNEAKRRHAALLSVDALVRGGHALMSARGTVAAQLQREGVRGASVATLGRWAKEIKGAPRDAWLALLTPAYVGRTATAEMPTEAWDIYKADWLRLEQPSAESCYARLQRVATEHGWELPSLRTFTRRIDREIPVQVQVLAREGEEALMRMYPAQERDRSGFAALEAVNADGHKFDVFTRFEDGTIGRPMMVGVQCLGSGKLLGYRVAQTESADLARLAFADVVRTYGIPRLCWLDNGRGFASKMLTGGAPTRYRFTVREEDPTGILVALGIEIHWATPYHGQAKPIERAWRDLCDRVAKHPAFAGAYTGNNPTAKPENYGSKAVPIEEFRRVLADEIAHHNAREGRRTKVCAGRSFDQTFAASYATAPIRRATPEQLRSMLLAADVSMSSRTDGSVRLGGNRYWCEALAPLAGQRLMVRFDPDNLHGSVAVYTMAGVYVADAECVAAVGFADTSAATEHARGKGQWRRAAKQQLAAERRMDAASVAAQLPTAPPENMPEPTVVAGMFGGKRNPVPESADGPMRRTGTDDHRESRLGDFLAAQLRARNAESGWTPPQPE
ncbi:MAG: transposase domain-containing protein [Xanthomonadaceae bacterium]|nr:transposase domain-containing protein [Xanthomonadaceae bacterium]MDP2185051.1 transposase domain-containing protein [Xanthomonadales bacterium]MDZ4114430.1 transposase domain-containing protein [Xanthomonadaceae bacterium]